MTERLLDCIYCGEYCIHTITEENGYVERKCSQCGCSDTYPKYRSRDNQERWDKTSARQGSSDEIRSG